LVLRIPPPPTRSTRLPYTTLFRSVRIPPAVRPRQEVRRLGRATLTCSTVDRLSERDQVRRGARAVGEKLVVAGDDEPLARPRRRDRKSTRLNSSHVSISYAVFCLK